MLFYCLKRISILFPSLAPSGCSSYSEVSSQRGPLHNGPPQDCRAMYNPMTPSMTPGPGPGLGSQGHGSCMNQYSMRPPMAPPPHSMMNHRGMMPNEGECSVFCERSDWLLLPEGRAPLQRFSEVVYGLLAQTSTPPLGTFFEHKWDFMEHSYIFNNIYSLIGSLT